MATFPELEPSTRAYNFGVFPISEASSLSAGVTRFRHNTAPQNYVLTLGFAAISDAQATLIRDHYRLQGGSHRSFALPTIVWRGHSATNNIAPSTSLWRYSETPEEEHLEIGYTSVIVKLVSDGEDLTALFNITVFATFVGGVAGASNGFAIQVTTIIVGHGAIGGLQIVCSIVGGAVTADFATTGFSKQVTASFEGGFGDGT